MWGWSMVQSVDVQSQYIKWRVCCGRYHAKAGPWRNEASIISEQLRRNVFQAAHSFDHKISHLKTDHDLLLLSLVWLWWWTLLHPIPLLRKGVLRGRFVGLAKTRKKCIQFCDDFLNKYFRLAVLVFLVRPAQFAV